MNTGCVPVTLTLFRPTLIIQVRSEGVALGRGGVALGTATVSLRELSWGSELQPQKHLSLRAPV